MEPRTYWQNYVDRKGGPGPVSDLLSIPYSTIAGVCNGNRGIGRDLAERMAQADPELDEKVLVWVKPEQKDSPSEAA